MFHVGQQVKVVQSPYYGDLPDGPVVGGDGVVLNVVGSTCYVKFRSDETLPFEAEQLVPVIPSSEEEN